MLHRTRLHRTRWLHKTRLHRTHAIHQHLRFAFRAQGAVCYRGVVNPAELAQADALPLHSRTPPEWGRAVLADPIALLIDHAFLEKKAAANAMELLTRWPNDGVEGWVETMTSVARDETAHLAQVTRILLNRGGKLDRIHKNPYANSLRLLVRKGDPAEILTGCWSPP